MTQHSGVLEWCENTLPLTTILVGQDRRSGIHKKYYPEDPTGTDCRRKMEVSRRNYTNINSILEFSKISYNIFFNCKNRKSILKVSRNKINIIGDDFDSILCNFVNLIFCAILQNVIEFCEIFHT